MTTPNISSNSVEVVDLIKVSGDIDAPSSSGTVRLGYKAGVGMVIRRFGDTSSMPIIASETASGSGSAQAVPADFSLLASAGKNVAQGTAYLAAVMGNLFGDSLTKTGNYLGGLIGAYSVTGVKATHYPAGAVLAQLTDGVTDADAVVAYIDGDSATTTGGAAFKVKSNNSTAASGFDFGVDLQDAAHDGFQPVDSAFFKKAQLRLTEDVTVKVITGAPVDGVAGTGAGVAGPGSMVVSVLNKKLYINTNTKASPTWTVVGTQA